LSKYSQVGSCFEVFIVRNPMVQSEFNFDVWLVIYKFFSFNQCCMCLVLSILFCFACMQSNCLSGASLPIRPPVVTSTTSFVLVSVSRVASCTLACPGSNSIRRLISRAQTHRCRGPRTPAACMHAAHLCTVVCIIPCD
jgi:hypothetical protein